MLNQKDIYAIVMPSCPKGTICLNSSTVVAGTLIFVLIVYICAMHARQWNRARSTKNIQHQPSSHTKIDKPESMVYEEGAETRKPSLLQRTANESKPILEHDHQRILTVEEPQEQTEQIEQKEAPILQMPSSFTAPQVTTNIYQTNTYDDPLLHPPLRRYTSTYNVPVAAMPINIKTRGPTPEVQQVGILRSDKNDKILALYGQPTFRGSSKWLYYTATDKYNSIRLPIEKSGRNCTGEYGCDELFEDEEIDVKGYPGKFKVSIYNLDAPRYIPYI